MLYLLRKETDAKTPNAIIAQKNGLDSLFNEVRVLKVLLGYSGGGGGGNVVRGDAGIYDRLMPLRTGRTNTVPPKRCDAPCLAQRGPKLRNTCMTVRCRSADGKRHRTVMQKAQKVVRSGRGTRTGPLAS